ncbi:MAG: acetylornithine deacetylase, partial [Acidobacteriota bacterium]
ELLRRLVAFDSVSRNSNHPIADFIADYLDRPGVRIERQLSDDGEKVNLIVTVGPEPGPEAQGLTLSGHMDVVPADEPEWTGSPFELRETEDRWIARGACDMKGFVALAVNAAASVDADTLRSPLALVLTFDEELGTLGAHHFVRRWPANRPLPRCAVIGEPTSLKAVRMHKGHASGRLVVRGTAAHSGYPHLGHSAVEPLGRAIVALSELRRQLEEERSAHSRYFSKVPFVALSMARVEAGSAINIVPEKAVMDLGWRVLPGVDSDAIAERIRERLEEALRGEAWIFERGSESPPMLLEEDHELNREVSKLASQTETLSASYATDGGWMHHSGRFDCVLYGPGDISVAHRPDEWLPKDEFERCSKDLRVLVEHFCA